MTAISQSEFMQALGWAILNSLWQMALLWILFQGITALFKIEKPSHKTALATTLLLTGFAWFIFTFVSIWTKTYEGTITATVISGIASDERLYNWLHTTLPIASVVYLVLLILPTLQFIRNYRFVQVIRTQGLKKIEVDWRIFVKKVAARMGIKKPVHIWISDMISSPVTVGYLKPVILVPIAAINHLTPQQLEAVLLHELSHIRRYDYLINLLINFIQTILYFNPFVKSFVKIIEREREKSCDEMVVQFQYDPHGYASALLILEKENHSSRPLAVAASGKKNDLVQRIELILGIHKKSVLSFNRLAGLMAGLLCIIGLNAVLIFAKPSAVDHPKNSLAFNNFSSPFFYLTGNELNREQELPKQNTINQIADRTQQQEKKISENKIKTVVQNNDPLFVVAPDDSKKAAPLFLNVNYHPAIEIPKLKAYQQAQINDALAKSKEVLQEGQWKALEKNIADALTSDEKGQLKKVYVKEFSKLDLEKWKDKLTLAYDKIDWERINEQLGKAVYDIKLDSLQMLYSDAAINLENLEQQLHETNQKGIPDSDITLKLIEEHKAEVQKMLNTIKAIRNKKIIHL
jgi:beta-lactamase regulating signal transducer with metallopeptidase domain